jgi:hypothetical protein
VGVTLGRRVADHALRNAASLFNWLQGRLTTVPVRHRAEEEPADIESVLETDSRSARRRSHWSR